MRGGRRSVAIAITGEPMIIPTANAVMRNPTWAMLTCKSAATSCSRPATMYSIVIIKNTPSVSSGTTNGSRWRCRVGAATD
nr:hypothetical protein [Gulosibacter sediminis]